MFQGLEVRAVKSRLEQEDSEEFQLSMLPGWLSKLWSLFGIPITLRHLKFRAPKKRDHNFDNHPHAV